MRVKRILGRLLIALLPTEACYELSVKDANDETASFLTDGTWSRGEYCVAHGRGVSTVSHHQECVQWQQACPYGGCCRHPLGPSAMPQRCR
jgi:hypothetical protein